MYRFASRLISTQRQFSSVVGSKRFFAGERYTKTHEWVRLNESSKTAVMGITDYAQHKLGEAVYVQVPEVGASFKKGETICSIESVKAAADVYSPLSGKVAKVNKELSENPKLVNDSATGKGWMVEFNGITSEDIKALLDEAAYKEHCKKEDESH